ncbi:MAG TPA: UrcA family protein [Steroidobacteraceae bacterium]|jgi:UrcA family protein
MTNLATKILLLGAFAGFAAAAGAAPAESDAPSLAVHYSSDALATDDGARALYHRIARAAEQLCPSDARLVPTAVRECRQQAIAGAVDKIHNQRLAAVHASYSRAG